METARSLLFPEFYTWLRVNYVPLDRVEEINGAAYQVYVESSFKAQAFQDLGGTASGLKQPSR